jgi:hypothetical protein
MSHRVSSKPAFRDLDRTRRCFEKLGWKVEANAIERSGYYEGKKFPFVARNPDAGGYDIGLELDSKTKEVTLHHESMLPMEHHFGQNLSLLKQEYAKMTLFDETEQRLGLCLFTPQADGSINWEIEVDMMT